MRLVYNPNSEHAGEDVRMGDIVTIDNEPCKVEYYAPPHKASSGGKVSISHLKNPDAGQREYFVSVIGAKWIEREDQGWVDPEVKRAQVNDIYKGMFGIDISKNDQNDVITLIREIELSDIDEPWKAKFLVQWLIEE